MIGKKFTNKVVLLIIVKRVSRFVIATKLLFNSADFMNHEINKIVKEFPTLNFKILPLIIVQKFLN